MEKTTVYLSSDLKLAVKRAARQRRQSEAQVIRDAIRESVAGRRPRPTPGLLRDAQPVADRVDELLAGFGEQ